jgi:hypothetical protein
MYVVSVREGRETARYCLFAASIDPESPKAFQGGAVVEEARGERLKAKPTPQREHDTMGGGEWGRW